MNHLFLSIEVNSLSQSYQSLTEKIKSLGQWVKIQNNFWYVTTTLNIDDYFQQLGENKNSNAVVIVSCKDHQLYWEGASGEVSNFIKNSLSN